MPQERQILGEFGAFSAIVKFLYKIFARNEKFTISVTTSVRM